MLVIANFRSYARKYRYHFIQNVNRAMYCKNVCLRCGWTVDLRNIVSRLSRVKLTTTVVLKSYSC